MRVGYTDAIKQFFVALRLDTLADLKISVAASSQWAIRNKASTTIDATRSLDRIGSYVVYGWIRAGIGGTPSS
jgi:hypothetical protein